MKNNFKKRIIVTGGNGQLATSFKKLDDNVICIGRPKFDLSKSQTIYDTIYHYRPNIIINTAAWTEVDRAEKNISEANIFNNTGPSILSAICKQKDILLIHISTDYVYSGEKIQPYIEADPVDPKTVYGYTKAEGEKAILAKNPEAIILRTSWVYAPHGKNFVKTIINVGAKNTEIKVVNDQYGNPTNADDLAVAILKIVGQLFIGKNFSGIYHITGSGSTNWYNLANFVLNEAQKYGQIMPNVIPIQTKDWPTPAERPRNSRLSCSKIKETFGIELPSWEESVKRTVEQIFRKNK